MKPLPSHRVLEWLVIWVVSGAAITAAIHPADELALKAFIAGFDPTLLAEKALEWLQNTSTACDGSWSSITCGADRITAISYEFLDDNAIEGGSPFVGVLSCSIFDLPALATFIFVGNNFQVTGELAACPNICTNSPQLSTFNVGKNALSGTIPSAFNNCPSLSDLRLNKNNFTGTLPDELFDTLNLSSFFVDENRLHGTISPKLWAMTGLAQLDLTANRFHGELPAYLPSNQTLSHFRLKSNSFNGTIPSWFWTLGSAFDALEQLAMNIESNSFDCDFTSHMPLIQAAVNRRVSVYDQRNCKPPAGLTFNRSLRFTPYRDETLHQLPQSYSHEFGNSKIQIRKSGRTFYIFAKRADGTLFETQFVCIEFQSLIYGTINGSALSAPIAEILFDGFSPVELSPARWRYNTTLPAPYNGIFSVTWDLNKRPQSAKFTLDLTGFAHDKNNAYFKFPFQYYVRGPIATTGTEIRFVEELASQQVIAPSFTTINTVSADIPDDDNVGTNIGVVVGTGTDLFPNNEAAGTYGISFSFISAYRIDGIPVAGLSGGLKTASSEAYVLPWGNVEKLAFLPQINDSPPPEIQGYTYVAALEVKQGIAASSFVDWALTGAEGFSQGWHFDPDISMLFVGDTSPSAPPSFIEEGSTIVVAVVVPVVVVLVAVLLIVFRRKVFPFMYRDKTKLSMTGDKPSENGKGAEMKSDPKHSRDWTPSVTARPITNV